MSVCNYCRFKQWQKEARGAGKKLTVIPDTEYKLGGVNIYIHPKTVNVRKLDSVERHKKYFKGWFMELPPSCGC